MIQGQRVFGLIEKRRGKRAENQPDRKHRRGEFRGKWLFSLIEKAEGGGRAKSHLDRKHRREKFRAKRCLA